MVNIITTNVDNGNVILDSATHRDKLLTFAAADTLVMGTVLATKSVADAVVVAAVGGNTGNGTVTLATVVNSTTVPAPGAYTLRVNTAVAHGGVLSLIDPNGAQIASNLVMTPGAGGATVFEVGGLQFTVTDGSTDFVVGDSFTLTVATGSNKLVPYSSTGAGGAQIATDVLTYEVTRTGAGDTPIRSMIAGRVRKERLVIDGVGAVTEAVIEQLRKVGIVAVEVQELGLYDNATV
jgi:hypothetical protein